jgi:hypothetical protein
MNRLVAFAGSLVDQIKINALTRETREGRIVWIKRRRPAAGAIMALANRFFALAGNPVRTLDDTVAWQRWEVGCFLQLHGDGFHAFTHGDHAVGADALPGKSLAVHLDAGELTPHMLSAAGRELRRAHEWRCDEFGGPWSHGDPHTGNFVYDEAGGRARLIDFEVMHDAALSADERHADDLLIFLQDLVGRITTEHWLPSARAFLGAYGRPEIVSALERKLIVPRGIARLWWSVRTTYLSPPELARRIAALRAVLPGLTD